MSEQADHRPHLLIVDDDPRIIDYYREALGLQRSAEELEADHDLDEMFSLLEGDSEEEHHTVTCPYRALTATQGLEALRLFKEMENEGNPFDLVLLDMRMPPGIDGMETAMILRESHPQLPIVFFTAYSDYSDAQLEQKVGLPFVLLRKPIASEDLLSQVEQMLRSN